MAFDTTIFSDDFQNLRDEWPTSFTYRSTSYSGILSDIDQESELQEGGFLESCTSILTILLSDFTSNVPTEGELVTISGIQYRIGKIKASQEGKLSFLYIINPNK